MNRKFMFGFGRSEIYRNGITAFSSVAASHTTSVEKLVFNISLPELCLTTPPPSFILHA
jgi:hypothetical protein